ncbi:MAG TPA: hypothetical protein VN832_13330 [Stellaceae bacterium]|nr:hypothetical protein [Stellaceae bacterium]
MIRRIAAPLASLALLWALWLPGVDAESHHLLIDLRPPAILMLLILLVACRALAGRRLPRGATIILAVLLFAAALLQAAAALVLRFLDRPLDLYFDPQHLPSLVGLFTDAMGAVRAALVLAAALLGAVALLAAIYWALRSVARALAPRGVVLGASVLALAVLGTSALPAGVPSPINTSAASAIADQAALLYRGFAVMHGYDDRYARVLAAPEPPLRDLPGLARQDVILIFVESYGTIVLDEPRFHAVVAPALADFAAVVKGAGYELVSSRLVSPTFGGGSWLAHGTLASGIKLDPFLDRLVMASHRRSLPRYLAAAGYRTIEIMPGIKKPWPEGAFWGFERSYYARDLGYTGPPFGWFEIPDQYTLRSFAEDELWPGHAPVFAQIVLVSSHTPFAPVPPYVADWRDAGAFASISQAQWRTIYREPDWSDLEAPYLASVVYDLQTLASFLARLDGKALVIILGDHQPPGFASGAKVPWTVPVHILSRDSALVAPFRRAGYEPGALPQPIVEPKGMESFLGDFLRDFSAGSAGD